MSAAADPFSTPDPEPTAEERDLEWRRRCRAREGNEMRKWKNHENDPDPDFSLEEILCDREELVAAFYDWAQAQGALHSMSTHAAVEEWSKWRWGTKLYPAAMGLLLFAVRDARRHPSNRYVRRDPRLTVPERGHEEPAHQYVARIVRLNATTLGVPADFTGPSCTADLVRGMPAVRVPGADDDERVLAESFEDRDVEGE